MLGVLSTEPGSAVCLLWAWGRVLARAEAPKSPTQSLLTSSPEGASDLERGWGPAVSDPYAVRNADLQPKLPPGRPGPELTREALTP